ncbi:MAG: LysR family transcriptional regulator [Oceanobacter sp.]
MGSLSELKPMPGEDTSGNPMGFVNYQDLYYFTAVVEQGSIVAAARHLSIPTSTLSRRIQHFEKSLGYKLIHRSAKHFGMTESGEKLYRSIGPVVQDLSLRLDDINSELSSLTGDLRITAPIGIGHHYLKPLIQQFMRENPRIQIELLLSNANSDLIKNSIDIAFRMGDITLNDWVSRRLFKCKALAVVAPDFDIGDQPIDHPTDLTDLPLIVTKGVPSWRFRRGSEQTSFIPKPYFRTDEINFAVDMVKSGLGISCLPEYAIREDLNAGRLVHILPEWEAVPREVSMIYPDRHNLPLKTRAFIDYVMAHFGSGGRSS